MDAVTGEVSVSRRLNRDRIHRLSVVIVAYDHVTSLSSTGNSSSITISIIIIIIIMLLSACNVLVNGGVLSVVEYQSSLSCNVTIVPIVPWEGVPLPGPPDQLPILPRCFDV